MKLTFLGAAHTVTGSKTLIEHNGKKILIDCGLFQGFKDLRLRNWNPFPVDPKTIDALVLTHAHIDHSGYIPVLVKSGFSGPIYCTQATADLCAILLRDAGHLQEEDAKRANLYKYSKHKVAKPLFTEKDAKECLSALRPIPFHQVQTLVAGLSFTFHRAGHILGAASISLTDGVKTILFSGDVGRPFDPLLKSPEKPEKADIVIMESTYGDRLHDKEDPVEKLKQLVDETVSRNGIILVPAFAVGRTQSLLYYFYYLKKEKMIPNIPIYVDSPMAISATRLLTHYPEEHRLSADSCADICGGATYVRTPEESMALNELTTSAIIISASGMATGGRVLHHLKHLLPNPNNTVLMAGYQAGGTRGDRLLRGETALKIHGEMIPVRAKVALLSTLSAHGDYEELLDWLSGLKKAPKTVFLNHGEPTALTTFKTKIEKTLGWPVEIPTDQDSYML